MLLAVLFWRSCLLGVHGVYQIGGWGQTGRVKLDGSIKARHARRTVPSWATEPNIDPSGENVSPLIWSRWAAKQASSCPVAGSQRRIDPLIPAVATRCRRA